LHQARHIHATLPSFFVPHPAPPEISPLSLHDALPISRCLPLVCQAQERSHHEHNTRALRAVAGDPEVIGGVCTACCHSHRTQRRSEEHTSELQSRRDLVCRLLLEKKKTINTTKKN